MLTAIITESKLYVLYRVEAQGTKTSRVLKFFYVGLAKLFHPFHFTSFLQFFKFWVLDLFFSFYFFNIFNYFYFILYLVYQMC